MNSHLKQRFIDHYGHSSHPISIFQAPGRVNLIGEHTDYNGGYVFPAALTFGTTLWIRPRNDRMVTCVSTNFPLKKQFDIYTLKFDPADDWINYPKAIIDVLQKQGLSFHRGYDLLFHGEIPHGAGLSSSASIEVVTAFALMTLEGYPVDRIALAKWAQKAENEFVGVHCGIMDQFAVANGKKDHALLLMCDTLAYEHVPMDLGEYQLVISNTNKRRGLLDSKYNERRSQCEQAVSDLQQVYPELTLLGQLTLTEFRNHQHVIQDRKVRLRAQHVVEEIDRVLQAVQVVKAGQLQAFGELMIQSHLSLRDQYEVTGIELDHLFEAALSVEGVMGSRMTGAGFGGCTISLVHEQQMQAFQAQVGTTYQQKTGLVADFYVCNIGDGVRQLEG